MSVYPFKRKWALALLLSLSAVPARAGEPFRFNLPDGWVVSPEKSTTKYVELVARHPKSGANVVGLHMPTAVPINDFGMMSFVFGARNEQNQLQELRRDYFEVHGIRVGRLVLSAVFDGKTLRQVAYLMPLGNETAALLFTTTQTQLDEQLASFDAVASATSGLQPSPNAFGFGVFRWRTALPQLLGYLLVVALLVWLVRRQRSRPKAAPPPAN
jgi:hypothetical protein